MASRARLWFRPLIQAAMFMHRVARVRVAPITMQALAFAMAMLSARASLAQVPRLPALRWQAPAGECADHAHVMAAIARWLAQSVAPVDASRLRVAAAVEPSQGRYALSLWLASPSGRAHERFAAHSCSTLVEVLALKVALAATSADLEPLPAASEALTPVEVSLRLNGSLGVGHLPGLSPGVGASVGWSFAGVRLELGAAYAPARAARYPTYPEAGVDVQLLSGTARTCLALAVLEVAVLTCGGIELGWMRAAGVATQQPMHSDHWIASVSFGPALRLRVTPAIGLWLELDAALAFVRPPGFYLRERATSAPLPEVYRSDFAAARLLAGIEMQLR